MHSLNEVYILATKSEKSRGFDKRPGNPIEGGNEALPGHGLKQISSTVL